MSEKYRINAFFNGVSSFKSAFPDLSDALVEWRELRGPEDERPADTRKTGYRRGNFTQGMLPCSNPTCHEGGYQIDRLIADMLAQEEMEREGLLLCAGREMGDETRRGPVRCPHRIAYKLVLSKREEPEKPKRFRRRRRPNRGHAA
ncbi:MAG TPA: hypothetical protein VFA78_09090 [Chloroflexota bacterium]|nr:hypothetical protein [Chloroflexota bacterium]